VPSWGSDIASFLPTMGSISGSCRWQEPSKVSLACEIRSRAFSIAIVPGGVTKPQESPGLVTLGTLFYEPLWLFSRGRSLEKHEQLHNLQISIGPEGSASRALSLEFFARVGIIDQKTATLLALTPQESATKLLNGDIDVAVLMGAWESPMVRRLLTAAEINLVSIRRADAFVALYPYLNRLVLPAGVADMAANRPPTDVVLLVPKASLVVREDLHPAIQYLLLNAASQIHSKPGLFHAAGQFPQSRQGLHRAIGSARGPSHPLVDATIPSTAAKSPAVAYQHGARGGPEVNDAESVTLV
jgi:hypothetical protein